MNEYKNNPKLFPEYRKKYFRKMLPILIILVIAVFCMAYFPNDGTPGSLMASIIGVLFLVVIMAFSNYRSLKKQRIVFEGYSFGITENAVISQIPGFTDKHIPFTEINSITERGNSGLIIKGATKADVIYISEYVDGYNDIKQRLNTMHPVVPEIKLPLLQKYYIAVITAPVVLMAVFYISENKIVFGISGTLLVLFLGWTFYATTISKRLEKPLKRGRWWVLFLMIIILCTMYAKLFLQW